MAIMKPPPGLRPADTNGWDCVSAVRIGEMNDAIATAGTSPTAFDAEPAEDMSVTGKFGAWAVGPGGDGHLINMIVPLYDVEIILGDEGHSIAQAAVKVRVRLTLMPAPSLETPGSRERQFLLVLDTTAPPVPEGVNSVPEKVASVLQIDGDEDLPIMAQVVLSSGLDNWFNRNLAAFHHVFATVNVAEISEEDSEGGLDWLKLTHVSYAFGHNSQMPENGVLAILGQTEGRSADGLIHQAQADMIPQGMEAAMCVSRSRFLHKMIVPALPATFNGLHRRDIAIKRRDTGLQVHKEIQLESIPHDGKTYDPVMERLDITLRDTDVKMESKTRTKISPGIFAMNETTATYAFGMDTNKKKQKTMKFEEVEPPTSREWTHTTTAVKIAQGVMAVFALVAGIVAIVATAGTATFAAAIVVGILMGVSSATIKFIEIVSADDGPPLDLLLANATASVTWATGTRFDPEFMALNGGLQIGGNFTEDQIAPETPGGLSERQQYQKSFQDRFAALMAERAPS